MQLRRAVLLLVALASGAGGLTVAPAPPKPALSALRTAAPHGARSSLDLARMSSASASLEAAAPQPSSGGSSVTVSAVNLAKNIVGSGVLALSAGVAAFTGARLGLVPALAALCFTGALSAYSFSLIARVTAAVGGSSYRDTFVEVFGSKWAFLPDVTVVFMTAVAALSYSIILGDSLASIAALAGAPALLCSSNAWIILLSVTVLLPLSLMRDLSSLAIGSAVGTTGTLYTALFMAWRNLDGTYRPGGRFFGAIAEAARPKFSAPTAATPLLNPSIFVLVSMLASAFLAHYNAPKFYNELQAPKDGSPKLGSFNRMCGMAFGLAGLLMGSIMCTGFLTFGSASQGLILNNYATSDTLAFIARCGIAASIMFSYPLNMVGLREGVLEMFPKLDGKKTSVHAISTLALGGGFSALALVFKDLGLLVALGGAILGSALVYIFPAMMAIAEKKGAISSKAEKLANWALAGLGLFFAGLGAVMCLK